MKEEKKNRTKYLKVRLTQEESANLQKKVAGSTCKKVSEYARKILFDKAIKCYYRNQSLDDFMAEIILLRNELNAIANNYNQVVKRLHSLQHLEEIKTWLLLNESTKQILLNKVSEIKSKMSQINDQWLQ